MAPAGCSNLCRRHSDQKWLMIINTFTGKTKYPYAAFDFETRTYIDGRLLSDDEIWRMCGEMKDGKPVYPQSWWRAHTAVECWAWIIYTPDGFAIAESFEEWLGVIQDARISCGWFYNAPFDFSILDYAMLSRGWDYKQDMKEVTAPRSFGELSSDYGARYTMTICTPYDRKPGDRSKRAAWRFRMHDLRNILHGGLATLLADFDVRDGTGAKIRKLEMDYQEATGKTAAEVDYMKNDAAGLWWLIDKAGAIMSAKYGLDIRGKKPDVLTASGLSKRVLLQRMYPESRTSWHRVWRFQRDHPMDIKTDTIFREHGLLGGGLVVVNEKIKGRHLTGLSMVRLDVNSEYPAYMHDMRSIYGRPYVYKTLEEATDWHGPDACYILSFSELHAELRPGAVACWRDPFTHAIRPEYTHLPMLPSLYIFKEEYDELTYWYNFDRAKLECVIVYDTRKEHAIEELIDDEYTGKRVAREAGEMGVCTFHKLTQNGLGGKYSQNPTHGVHVRKIATGDNHVSFLEVGTSQDEKSLMQVVQGARITCAGRCMIRRYARMICGGTENTADHWFYGDTDSLHLDRVTVPPEIVDPYRLGALKQENKTPIKEACFLAPKTYYEREESWKVEIHAKGINTSSIIDLLESGVSLADIYTPGYRIQSLTAINVKGGKALLPFPKQILGVDELDESFY